jgi:hypothetical protein
MLGCCRSRPLGRSNDSRPSVAATSACQDFEPNGWPRGMLRTIASSSLGPNGRLTRAVQSRGRSIGQDVKVGRSASSLARRAERLPISIPPRARLGSPVGRCVRRSGRPSGDARPTARGMTCTGPDTDGRCRRSCGGRAQTMQWRNPHFKNGFRPLFLQAQFR